ncbi:L-lactate dehydrogenase complex protein LldE [Haloferula luteola]|uniref:L-lactate dehydrogenase complex protein LldE n=1 Tax=Haloferula luteola TaxID=595692 RepID=A0A840VEP8_9BACT|nr:(Fe-S)-binding protein [Haloferula luteola]MBB5353108.1 L-lactate dehydrogenase complex protein LldE [Haloferula luteola]
MSVPLQRPVANKVLFMATCLCDAFYDDAARASVEVLEHLGIEVIFPENQTCCGQPAFNSGDWKASRKVARHAAEVFGGDLPVIVPSGSCAAMHSHGNRLQFEACPEPAIESLANRTWEILDYLVHGLGISTWKGAFAAPTRIAFHRSCHTRGTRTGEAAHALLSSIRNAEVVAFGQEDQCCGFGGTFSVTFPHISGRMGSLKLDHILAQQPDLLVSADMSCLMHLTGLARTQGRPVQHQHAIQVLRDTLA